jgi:integrase/recombinase XerC/integrase/recombinase XerD
MITENTLQKDIIEVKAQELSCHQSFESLIEDFLTDQDISVSSKATYARSLKQFINWLYESDRGNRLDLQREDILAYKSYLADKSSYTVTLYLTSVRKLYQWLESRRIYPDITRGIKGARKAKGFRKDTLTPAQLREALEAIERKSLTGLRDYALFNLMARTGLRDVEVSRALIEDVRQEAGQAVLWIQGKGRDTKDDFVLLTEEALQPIRQYLQARGEVQESDPLFCSASDRNFGQSLTTRSISRIVKKAFRRIGLDDSRITAHSLRHTAISLSVAGGASLQQAQAMARHTDPKTTLVYFHNYERIKAGAEKCIEF